MAFLQICRRTSVQSRHRRQACTLRRALPAALPAALFPSGVRRVRVQPGESGNADRQGAEEDVQREEPGFAGVFDGSHPVTKVSDWSDWWDFGHTLSPDRCFGETCQRFELPPNDWPRGLFQRLMVETKSPTSPKLCWAVTPFLGLGSLCIHLTRKLQVKGKKGDLIHRLLQVRKTHLMSIISLENPQETSVFFFWRFLVFFPSTNSFFSSSLR